MSTCFFCLRFLLRTVARVGSGADDFKKSRCVGLAVTLVLLSLAGSAHAQTAPPVPDVQFNADGVPQPTPGVKPTMPPSTASRRPDLFAPLPFYRRRNNLFFNAAADLRYRNRTTSGTSETIGGYVAATRFTLDYIRANPVTGDERGGARFQLVLEDDQQGTSLNRLRASEVYAFYRFLFPGVSANVRVGQFVLPFGILATYDTPLQPIQPLYELSLGLRVDTGIMIEGEYGKYYHYAGSITTGAGPNRRDTDTNSVLTFRLDRTFPTRLGQFQIGGSLLTGNGPITNFDTILSPSGFSGARDRSRVIRKTRFAGDGIYRYGPFLGRGEIVFGADDQDPVWGYFVEGNVQVRRQITLVAYGKRWNFPNRPEHAGTMGIGANFDVFPGFTIRTLFEYERDVPSSGEKDQIIKRRLTLQTRVTF
ncbi:MAG: hypothetical protein SFU56_17305 [Capsulimonadales bacterium]|nr:hypothetical protein [Capsulimonadales bacterium]